MQYHVFFDGYTTPWGDARLAFYDAEYTPTAFFDGADPVVGAIPDLNQQYNLYRVNHFLPRRAVATDVTLAVSAQDLGGQTFRVSVQVGIEPAGQARSMRIYTVQVLDHWPSWPTYHRNTFKQAAPTQDIALAPGESQVVETVLTFDTDSWNNQKDIKIVAWAQTPNDNGPAEVFQATVREWPLESSPWDMDGDGIPDFIDNCPNRANELQEDSDSDKIGDACDNCIDVSNLDQANADEDGRGDACDTCPSMHHLNLDDTDGDGIGDPCDVCPEIGFAGRVDRWGRLLGSVDQDCDVDLADLAMFASCLAGPGLDTAPPECSTTAFLHADGDADDDVDLADFSIVSRNFTGPMISPPFYLGAQSCTECHADQHADWTQTIHAVSFNTLLASGDGDNPLCFPCHAVGYGQAGGFVDLPTTPHLAGVQCESCHGPGSNHAVDPENVHLEVDMSGNLCGVCHQSCHGLCGDDHHPQHEQWLTSAHARALRDIQLDPDLVDDCLRCHSTDYRLAPIDNKPTVAEATLDLECVACHRPHGSENSGQLRLPRHLLCAECHTTEGSVPGEEPSQPQAETLHAVGGFALSGEPLEGPYSMHWWGIANECVTCHVYSEPYGGPDQPVNSGHTFQANMRACLPCHSESTATLLVTTARYEIETRLGLIAPYFDPGDPSYLDPATLAPQDVPRYEVARFNYLFVLRDRSYGSHNADYARALLAQCESFLGIEPWRRNASSSPGTNHARPHPIREMETSP